MLLETKKNKRKKTHCLMKAHDCRPGDCFFHRCHRCLCPHGHCQNPSTKSQAMHICGIHGGFTFSASTCCTLQEQHLSIPWGFRSYLNQLPLSYATRIPSGFLSTPLFRPGTEDRTHAWMPSSISVCDRFCFLFSFFFFSLSLSLSAVSGTTWGHILTPW